jgi:histone-lysine N-methyltransferase SETMAR
VLLLNECLFIVRIKCDPRFSVISEMADLKNNGHTVNQHHYLEVLKRLRDQVRRKCLERWRNQDCLLHNTAPAHTALSVQRFLAAKNMAVVPHPPYSPDLIPCDLFLFRE